MSRFMFTIFVAAPPRQVFDLWIDLKRVPEWVGGVSRVTDITGAADRAGTSYTVWFGRMASRTEVLDADPPHSIRTRFGNRLLRGINEATFEPEDGGTRLTQRLETQGWVAGLMARIFAVGSYKGSFRGELATFARLAETDAREGGTSQA
jgi:uncharacterized protein YndB with AHSA1/START domain